MLTLNIGPLALAVTHLILLASLLLATLVGWWSGRRSGLSPEPQLFRLLLVGLLVARLAFVIRYRELYAGDIPGMLDIRDGGFMAWPGIVAALLAGCWLGWRRPALRLPLAAAVVSGLLLWGLGHAMLQAYERGTAMPPVTLWNLEEQPVALEQYRGKPLVINLWATWCPPCRREMPVLAEAQVRHDGIAFVFVNQGEGAELVQQFLDSQQLQLDNVLLDRSGRLGQLVGSRALPTTLFYDAEGRQVSSHLGELSRASLAHALNQLQEEANTP